MRCALSSACAVFARVFRGLRGFSAACRTAAARLPHGCPGCGFLRLHDVARRPGELAEDDQLSCGERHTHARRLDAQHRGAHVGSGLEAVHQRLRAHGQADGRTDVGGQRSGRSRRAPALRQGFRCRQRRAPPGNFPGAFPSPPRAWRCPTGVWPSMRMHPAFAARSALSAASSRHLWCAKNSSFVSGLPSRTWRQTGFRVLGLRRGLGAASPARGCST